MVATPLLKRRQQVLKPRDSPDMVNTLKPSLCGSALTRRPASGSGLSLRIPSWHAVLSDPGESDIDMFQNFDADVAFAE